MCDRAQQTPLVLVISLMLVLLVSLVWSTSRLQPTELACSRRPRSGTESPGQDVRGRSEWVALATRFGARTAFGWHGSGGEDEFGRFGRFGRFGTEAALVGSVPVARWVDPALVTGMSVGFDVPAAFVAEVVVEVTDRRQQPHVGIPVVSEPFEGVVDATPAERRLAARGRCTRRRVPTRPRVGLGWRPVWCGPCRGSASRLW